VLGAKVKQVQGITSAVNGILAAYTGVDNKVDGTFNIRQGVSTPGLRLRQECARTAKGDCDVSGWAMVC
jgi:hypothetical protein